MLRPGKPGSTSNPLICKNTKHDASAVRLLPDASFDTVLADLQSEDPSAVGSEAVDLLGFDISL